MKCLSYPLSVLIIVFAPTSLVVVCWPRRPKKFLYLAFDGFHHVHVSTTTKKCHYRWWSCHARSNTNRFTLFDTMVLLLDIKRNILKNLKCSEQRLAFKNSRIERLIPMILKLNGKKFKTITNVCSTSGSSGCTNEEIYGWRHFSKEKWFLG